MLKVLFITASIALALLLSIYKLFICKHKQSAKISEFVSLMTGILLIYVIISIIYGIVINGFLNKILLLFLGLSPFIIGKFVTYENEKLYSWLQITVVFIGIAYFSLV